MLWIFKRTTDGRLRAGWRYVLFLVTLFAAALAASRLLGLLSLPPLRNADGVVQAWPLLTQGLALTGVVVGVTAALLRLIEKRPLSSAGLPMETPWMRGVAAGGLLGAAPVVILVGLLAVTGHAELAAGTLTPASLLRSWLPAVLGLALVSSVEELTLRGYGLQLLAEAGGRWFAAILTGLLFGFMHAENPGANPAGLVSTAANGVLLAWLVMRTGSLWMACAYHASWNITGAMILGMRLSGTDQGGGLLLARLTGPDWLTGGAYGFEGSVVIGVIELLVLGAAVVAAPRLPGHPDVIPFFRGQSSSPER